MTRTAYHDCMDNHNHTPLSRDDTDHHVPDSQAPMVSEMLPTFLDHLRVEEHRTPTTLIRYESHIQKFITTVGDCPINRISSEHLSLYKRRLLDESLAPATMAAMLSGLRSFLRYCKEVRGFQVYDPEKVRRPKIPKHEVEYLTKEEVQRFIRRTSQSTEPILRTLGLAPQGEGAGLERKFDIVATVDLRLDLQHLLIERAHRLKMRGHNRDECELHETFPFSER